jgi:hypothetical protein
MGAGYLKAINENCFRDSTYVRWPNSSDPSTVFDKAAKGDP